MTRTPFTAAAAVAAGKPAKGRGITAACRGFACMLTLIFGLMLPGEVRAQASGIHFAVDFDLMVDCDQPIQVRNFIVHGSGSGILNSDKTGSADLQVNTSIFPSTVHFEGRLGRASQVAPGGSAQARVIGRNRLRLTWDLPNNQLIGEIVIAGRSCSANLISRLKRGQIQYSLFDGSRFFYCGRPSVVRISCAVS